MTEPSWTVDGFFEVGAMSYYYYFFLPGFKCVLALQKLGKIVIWIKIKMENVLQRVLKSTEGIDVEGHGLITSS